MTPHLGGRPTGHGGSDSHGLLAATHQQAGRLLGHPLQLGSPPLIGPNPVLFQPPHNCRLQVQVTASLRSTTCVGEQAYSDHVGGRPATTGQSKQGAKWSHSHSAFACHHWFGQTETETLVMSRTSWGELDVPGHILTYLSCSLTSYDQKSIKRFVYFHEFSI